MRLRGKLLLKASARNRCTPGADRKKTATTTTASSGLSRHCSGFPEKWARDREDAGCGGTIRQVLCRLTKSTRATDSGRAQRRERVCVFVAAPTGGRLRRRGGLAGGRRYNVLDALRPDRVKTVPHRKHRSATPGAWRARRDRRVCGGSGRKWTHAPLASKSSDTASSGRDVTARARCGCAGCGARRCRTDARPTRGDTVSRCIAEVEGQSYARECPSQRRRAPVASYCRAHGPGRGVPRARRRVVARARALMSGAAARRGSGLAGGHTVLIPSTRAPQRAVETRAPAGRQQTGARAAPR